ncbi:MAG: recombination protein RecR [Neisseriales bacterium]|nr:MAG: recombination protein RecR [Neisseriales bacterium]
MKPIASLDRLVHALKILPSVGSKSAQRMAFHLLQHDKLGAQKLALAIHEALDKVKHCEACNTFSEQTLCPICIDDTRQKDILMVVEMPTNLAYIEQTGCYNGLYFVLMGRLSPLEGIGLHDIALTKLVERASKQSFKEIIIATNFTAEGEATAHIISTLLKPHKLSLSRIARGIPVGGEIEYIDQGTLAQAIHERRLL